MMPLPPGPGLDGRQTGGTGMRGRASGGLLLLPVGAELADIGPEVLDVLRVLDAGEDHLCARDHRPRIGDVFLEIRLVPDDAGVLVGVGIAEARRRAGMAAVDAVELGADLVLGAL